MSSSPHLGSVDFILDPKVSIQEASSASHLSYFPTYLADKVLLLHEIQFKISQFFRIETQNIKFCGSAQYGYSFWKNTKFSAGNSDLDVAIISKVVFGHLLDYALESSECFKDLRKFKSVDQANKFRHYVSDKGMIRPDLLPDGSRRSEWWEFFGDLSNYYKLHFKNISAAVFLTERAFVMKQEDTIAKARGEI